MLVTITASLTTCILLSDCTRCWETSESKFFKLSTIRNNCGNSGGGLSGGNTKLYHRGCCHGDKATDLDYLSAMTRAINESFESLDGEKKKQQMTRSEAYEQIKRSYNTAKREETKFGEYFWFVCDIDASYLL